MSKIGHQCLECRKSSKSKSKIVNIKMFLAALGFSPETLAAPSLPVCPDSHLSPPWQKQKERDW